MSKYFDPSFDPRGFYFLLVGVGLGLAYIAYTNLKEFRSLLEARNAVVVKSAETEKLSKENFRLANTDMLTDLGSRRALFADMSERIGKSGGDAFALGILDLDGFKAINDGSGHQIGDQILVAVAERLKQTIAAECEIYRLGGDEFAFFTSGLDEAELQIFGDWIIDTVREPVSLGDLHFSISCSIGFANYPDAAASGMELYDKANYALYHAKKTGRSKTVVFNDEHEKDVRESAVLDRAMRAADLDTEFYLQFQPIVDPSREKTILLECLARWESPSLGRVSPGAFIVVAEQSGFISTLTVALLKKALRAAQQWPDTVGISFNLSGHTITSTERVMELIDIVKTSGVSPNRIEFEVTETAIMLNMDKAVSNIHLLKAMGSKISLDDFGTGYSSLSQIQKLPLDKIKVDGSFVRNLENDEASQKIVSSIQALSADLKLSCVVEGVETKQQLDLLRGMGSSLIQGYYYSRPMPETEVSGFIGGNLADILAERDKPMAA